MGPEMKRGSLWALLGAVTAAACANGGPTGIAGDLGGPGAAEREDGSGQAGEDASPGNDGGGRITGEDASQSGNDAGSGEDAGGGHDGGAAKDAGQQQPPQDAGNGNSTCAGPNTPANCHACSGQNCQPNGCYNGYVCDTVTDKCKAPNSCP
jgi:hypothetical protein